MATDPRQAGMLSAMLSQFSTRINDLEEKQNTLHEKLAVLGQTLLSNNQRLTKEMAMLSDDMSSLKQDIEKIRNTAQILLEQSADYARKQELLTLDKYMKAWEPMQYATLEDVKQMLNAALKNKKASSKDKIIPVEE